MSISFLILIPVTERWFILRGNILQAFSLLPLVKTEQNKTNKKGGIHADAFLAVCQVFPPDTTQATHVLVFFLFYLFTEYVNNFVEFMAFLYFQVNYRKVI